MIKEGCDGYFKVWLVQLKEEQYKVSAAAVR